MNDCFFSWLGCEDGCAGCKFYLSANSDEGEKVLRQYESEIEAVVNPIAASWLSRREELV